MKKYTKKIKKENTQTHYKDNTEQYKEQKRWPWRLLNFSDNAFPYV